MNENETNVAVAEVETPAEVVAVVELPSPDALTFCTVVNSCETRKQALAKFAAQGFHMTYPALVARIKNYREKKGVTNLKTLKGVRGSTIDGNAINEQLASQASEAEAAKAIVG